MKVGEVEIGKRYLIRYTFKSMPSIGFRTPYGRVKGSGGCPTFKVLIPVEVKERVKGSFLCDILHPGYDPANGDDGFRRERDVIIGPTRLLRPYVPPVLNQGAA